MSSLPRRLRAFRAALGPASRRSGPALLSIVDQGFVSGFGFVAGVLAARLVGIEEFGRFVLALIAAALAQGLHNALVTAPMMTLAGPRQRAAATYDASLLAGAFLLSLPLALGVALMLGVVFVARGEAVPLDALAAAAALTIAQNMQLTLRRMLFARGGGASALAMDVIRACAFPLAVGAAWLAGRPIGADTLLWVLAATALAAALPFAWPIWRSNLRRLRLGAVARRHWRIARWLFPIVFVTFGQEQLVWIIVGAAIGDDALGGLRAAQYLVGLVLVLLAATENLVPTRAGRAYLETGVGGLRRYLLQVTASLGALVAVLLLAVAVPAETWLRLLFGEPFAAYASSARILALGVAFIFVRDMAAHFFRATQRTGVIFRAFVASFIVSLALLGPLLDHDGVAGAAIVVVIGHAASMAYLLAASARSGAFAARPPRGC